VKYRKNQTKIRSPTDNSGLIFPFFLFYAKKLVVLELFKPASWKLVLSSLLWKKGTALALDY
jgi:hypothetical protein